MTGFFQRLVFAAFLTTSQSESVDRLIEKLGSDSSDQRAGAQRELLLRYEAWTTADLDLLTIASKAGDAEKAKRAGEALSRIQIRRELGPDLVRQVPDLDAALHFRGEEDRLWALKEIGARIRKGAIRPKTLEFVLACVGTPPLEHKAQELIGFVFEEHLREFAPLLVPYLEEKRPEVRASAIKALGWLGAREHVREIAGRLETDPAAAVALATLGAGEHLDRMLELMKGQDARFGEAAALAVGLLGDRRAVAPLLQRLDDRDAAVRALALYSLAAIGDPVAAPRMVRLFKDPDETVRRVALAALVALRCADGFEDARLLLQDPSDNVRKMAAVYLAKNTPLDAGALRDRVAAEIQSALLKPGVELWTVFIHLGDAAPRPLKKYLEWLIQNPLSGAPMILDALARTLEPAAYAKLTLRVELETPMASLEDARAFFRRLGFELEAPDGFGGRVNAGVRVDGQQILTERFRSTTGFVLHKDRVVVLPWEQAIREWIKKVDRQ